MIRVLWLFVIVLLIPICALTIETVTISDRGSIHVYDAKEKRIKAWVNSFGYNLKFVGDTYYDTASMTIYVANEDRAGLYQVNTQNGIKCDELDTQHTYVHSILFDPIRSKPYWIDYSPTSSDAVVRTIGGAQESYNPEDITSVRLGLPESLFPGSEMTSSKMRFKYQKLTGILKDQYEDRTWIRDCRSISILVYGLYIADTTASGEEFKLTMLIYNKPYDFWHLYTMEESGYSSVFDDVLVIQGMYSVKDNYDSRGRYIQPNPTGNWYFYFAQQDRFSQIKLDPEWKVTYADNNNVYIAKHQHERKGDKTVYHDEVWIAPVTDGKVGEPYKVTELPDDFEIYAIYPNE